MSRNIIAGREGEEQAALYFEKMGYEIIARNYRYKRAEIDLIIKKENLLVFVEVKLRSTVIFGLPEDAVDEKKEEMVLSAADNYIYENDWKGEIRFDVISIISKKEIKHFEDAFG
jgi:putative endonuclease